MSSRCLQCGRESRRNEPGRAATTKHEFAGASQTLEAGGARRLGSEFFFSALQLKRHPLGRQRAQARWRQRTSRSVYGLGVIIVLLPYDEAWPLAFESEAARLRSAFGDLFVDLQHIGSTAVPG